MFGRKKRNPEPEEAGDFMHDSEAPRRGSSDPSSAQTLTADQEYDEAPSKAQIKRATRTRLCWALACSFLLLISVVFVILVEIGNTKVSSTLNDIYFIKINLANIIPTSVPNAQLINSIAQSIGLHDFYTVGLWNFCEGYKGQGVTSCSKPETLYWFNPVEIITNELVAGATIALPAEIDDILSLIRTVSHWMFALFLSGACLEFLMIFLVPLAVASRWATLPIMIFTFLGALFTTVATVVATVLFIIARNTITQVQQLNIGASIGVEMFAFMWVSAAAGILAWLIMLCLCCCCASRRDVKKGKKRGSKKAWGTETPGVSESEKPVKEKKGLFGRKKKVES